MSGLPTAAIVTVGTELTTGMRRDTNGSEIARALRASGYRVATLTSLPDDIDAVADALAALTALHALVVVTGGLGPTHDDITREAASRALKRSLIRDETIAERLRGVALRHSRSGSRDQMFRQADVLEGARVLPAVAGTAPAQVVPTPAGELVLLPGPPNEMRPLLEAALSGRGSNVPPVRLRCIGITESDAQHVVQPAIAPYPVEFTLLAGPDDVEVVLFAEPADASSLTNAARDARAALGTVCYSEDGSSLAEVVLDLARRADARLACAESCTGGLVAAALTDVPGSSEVFVGGVVAYSNELKTTALGVSGQTLAQEGAVSEATALAMAEGALGLPGVTLAVSTTGIAGPGGGSDEKPVGLVWFGLAAADGTRLAVERRFGGDRDMVRRRATAAALDLLRRELSGA